MSNIKLFSVSKIIISCFLIKTFQTGICAQFSNSPSQNYGPPQKAIEISSSISNGNPSNFYGPPQTLNSSGNPDTNYGPPGFTPGMPLGEYQSSYGSGGNSRSCRNTNLEANKKLVMDFYQKAFGDKMFEVLDQYIAQDVINHNPMEVDGIDGLREVLMGPLGQGPPMKIDFRRVSAEDDLVWTHLRLPVPALGITYAVIDIFRINCEGKIQEHWDVLQDTNVESKNSHPFF